MSLSKRRFIPKFFSLSLLFSLGLLMACTSINPKKYGFEGEYIKPFRDGAKYIEADGDAKPVAYILREMKNQPPKVLVRLTTGSLGTWYNLANVKMTLASGKAYTLTGPIERWGRPTRTRTWTDTLTSIDVARIVPFLVIVNETPTYDGQVYTWTRDYGFDENTGLYRYRVNTGRYNIRHESSMTYEALYAENLSDADLTVIAQAETVDLTFTSRDADKAPQVVKGVYNQPHVKGALMNYYFTTKELMRVQAELHASKTKKK